MKAAGSYMQKHEAAEQKLDQGESLQNIEDDGMPLPALARKLQRELDVAMEWKEVKHKLRESKCDFFIYFIYLTVFTVVIFNQESEYSFRFNQAMIDLLIDTELPTSPVKKTFLDVLEIGDLYEWMEQVFIPSLFDYNFPSYAKEGYGGFSFGINVLVGPVRMRQVRVEKEDCTVSDKIVGVFSDTGCFPRMDKGSVDTEWSRSWRNETSDDVAGFHSSFTYQDSSDTQIDTQWASVATYEGGGYVVDFQRGNTTAQHVTVLQELQASGWIDHGSRGVILDMTVYNPALNLFHVSQLFFEILPMGAIIPSYQMRTLNLWRYELSSFNGVVQVVAEGLLMVMTAGYFLVEVKEVMHNRMSYLFDVWNVLDILVLVLFVAALAVRADMFRVFNASIFDADNPGEFYPFQPLLLKDVHVQNILAVNALLLWFKVFKFTTFIPGMDIINKTIAASFRNTAWFLVMFAFVIIGYATAGVLAFGSQIYGFSTFLRSVSSLIVALLGEISLSELATANRYFGALFFFSFVILCFFILLSMFLAILSEAYEAVKQEQQKNSNHNYGHLLQDDLIKQYNKYFGRNKGQQESMKAKAARSRKAREAMRREKQTKHARRSALDYVDLQRVHQVFENEIAQTQIAADYAERRHWAAPSEDSYAEFFRVYGVNVGQTDRLQAYKEQRQMIRRLNEQVPSSDSDEDDESIASLKKIIKKLRAEIKQLKEKPLDQSTFDLASRPAGGATTISSIPVPVGRQSEEEAEVTDDGNESDVPLVSTPAATGTSTRASPKLPGSM